MVYCHPLKFWMILVIKAVSICAGLLLSFSVFAESLEFNSVWARATPPGAKTAAVFGVFSNEGDTVIGIESLATPVAMAAMIHETVMADGMMKMKHAHNFTVPAHGAITFAPGGYHVMLAGVNQSLRPGDTFPLEVHLTTGDVVAVTVVVGEISQMTMP